MYSKLYKTISILSFVIIVGVFMTILFLKDRNTDNLAFIIENENLSKMDDSTSIRFNESFDVNEEVKEEQEVSDNIVLVSSDDKKESIVKDNCVSNSEEENIVSEPVVDTSSEEKEVSTSLSLFEDREVLETVVGNLTGYGPDCVGCGGLTSSGFDLTQSIYYEDSEFGTVRILAADRGFPLYSVFRVSNVPTMDDFIGIVLDRGGNVGFGKGTLFDLAFESEHSSDLVPLTRNVTFELLRRGA